MGGARSAGGGSGWRAPALLVAALAAAMAARGPLRTNDLTHAVFRRSVNNNKYSETIIGRNDGMQAHPVLYEHGNVNQNQEPGQRHHIPPYSPRRNYNQPHNDEYRPTVKNSTSNVPEHYTRYAENHHPSGNHPNAGFQAPAHVFEQSQLKDYEALKKSNIGGGYPRSELTKNNQYPKQVPNSNADRNQIYQGVQHPQQAKPLSQGRHNNNYPNNLGSNVHKHHPTDSISLRSGVPRSEEAIGNQYSNQSRSETGSQDDGEDRRGYGSSLAQSEALALILSGNSITSGPKALSRVLRNNEVYNLQYIAGAQHITCSRETEFLNVQIPGQQCLVCACVRSFGHVVPMCADCTGCDGNLGVQNTDIEQTTIFEDAILEGVASCAPLPTGVLFEHPLNPCQICICQSGTDTNKEGLITCSESPHCVKPSDVPALPSTSDSDEPVPTLLCQKFPKNIEFPHPEDSCQRCKCLEAVVTVAVHTSGHIVCRPNPTAECGLTEWPSSTEIYQTVVSAEDYNPELSSPFEPHRGPEILNLPPEQPVGPAIFPNIVTASPEYNLAPQFLDQPDALWQFPPGQPVETFPDREPEILIPGVISIPEEPADQLQYKPDPNKIPALPWPPITIPDYPTPSTHHGPLLGPPPHESCKPYPADVHFQHPWDDCRTCVCSEFHSQGHTSVEVNCFTKESCCVTLEELSSSSDSKMIALAKQKKLLESSVSSSEFQQSAHLSSQVQAGQVKILDKVCEYKSFGVEFISPADPCRACTCQLFGSVVVPGCHRASSPECKSPSGFKKRIKNEQVIYIELRCRTRDPNVPFATGCHTCNCQTVFNFVVAKCSKQPNCVSSSDNYVPNGLVGVVHKVPSVSQTAGGPALTQSAELMLESSAMAAQALQHQQNYYNLPKQNYGYLPNTPQGYSAEEASYQSPYSIGSPYSPSYDNSYYNQMLGQPSAPYASGALNTDMYPNYQSQYYGPGWNSYVPEVPHQYNAYTHNNYDFGLSQSSDVYSSYPYSPNQHLQPDLTSPYQFPHSLSRKSDGDPYSGHGFTGGEFSSQSSTESLNPTSSEWAGPQRSTDFVTTGHTKSSPLQGLTDTTTLAASRDLPSTPGTGVSAQRVVQQAAAEGRPVTRGGRGLCQYAGDLYHLHCQACHCFAEDPRSRHPDPSAVLYSLCVGTPCET